MSQSLKSSLILIFVSIIWGSTFVAQHVSMDDIGPLAYTGIRFLLGGLLLLPLAVRKARRGGIKKAAGQSYGNGKLIKAVLFAGLALTGGAALQQIGMVETNAGKAGFITGLYVVMVPLFLLLGGRRPSKGELAGVVMSVVGLYLLSIQGGLVFASGDGWVFASTFIWAAHLLILGRYSPDVETFAFASGQFLVCALVCLGAAAVLEKTTFEMMKGAAVPILYGGVISVGCAYTLQIVAQKNAPPTATAIILSLETVFAAIFGMLVLGERMNSRELTGAALMFCGMMAAQVGSRKR